MSGTQKRKSFPSPDTSFQDVADRIFDDFLGRFEEKINDPGMDRNEIVRDTLYRLYAGGIPDFARLYDHTFPIGARAQLACFDPRGVTLDAESCSDIDINLYFSRKPLIWFWLMFDRSPLGLNSNLGIKLRRMLAPYIFKSVGKNFRCAGAARWTFGYKLTVGHDVVIGHDALLDDRGGLDIGCNVTVGDSVKIYSHSPEPNVAGPVNKARTVIGDRVRLCFHTTILPGVHIGEGALVEPMSLVTRNVKPHQVLAGTPAESVTLKSKARARS
jgi:acetyltransferase-like isoleucine patch superfamily enzyme